MQEIFLYWLAAQHELSAFRRKIFAFFCRKFSSKVSGFNLNFKKQLEVARKMAKINIIPKNAYMPLLEAMS